MDLAKEYGRNPSTISTIIKMKEEIKKLKPSKGVNIISKLHTNIHDGMERLLLIWIKAKELADDSVSVAIICEKASTMRKKDTPRNCLKEERMSYRYLTFFRNILKRRQKQISIYHYFVKA